MQEVIRFAAIAWMAAIAAHLVRKHRDGRAARIGALFTLGMAVYLVLPWVLRYTENRLVTAVLLFPAFSNSFLLWMLSRSLFSERAKSHRIHYALWGLSQLVSYLVYFRFPSALFQWGSGVPEFEFMRNLLPQGIYLAFILAAIIASQQEAGADLVASRIKLRRAFLAVAAFYGVLVCAAEILLQGQPASPGTDTVHHAILLVLAGLGYREVRAHPDLFPAGPEPPRPPAEPSPLRKELERWVEVEKVYRQEGLTITQLAGQMRTQEYLLRACINKELGFRNFNDFLNHYRVLEACSRLGAEPGLPIFNLSLELGYRSLAPFNRAFKAKTGKTPSQYRVENRKSTRS